MRVYYDQDCDVNIVKETKIAILGYGSQGHAHAANLKDSGVKKVFVALKDTSLSIEKAKSAGFETISIQEAAKVSDILMLATPDEIQGCLYKEHIHNQLKY